MRHIPRQRTCIGSFIGVVMIWDVLVRWLFIPMKTWKKKEVLRVGAVGIYLNQGLNQIWLYMEGGCSKPDIYRCPDVHVTSHGVDLANTSGG